VSTRTTAQAALETFATVPDFSDREPPEGYMLTERRPPYGLTHAVGEGWCWKWIGADGHEYEVTLNRALDAKR